VRRKSATGVLSFSGRLWPTQEQWWPRWQWRKPLLLTAGSSRTGDLEAKSAVSQQSETQASIAKLTDIGFRKVGEWEEGSTGGIRATLQACADAANILYAFVSDGAVLYVGKTTLPLKRRIYGYQRPGPTQSTNIKGNRMIGDLLAAGKKVEIYALPDNGLLHFGAFHLNLAAGLEDSIVAELKPEWNRAGKGLA